MNNIKLSNQILFCFFTCYMLTGCILGKQKHSIKREEGFVPNETTAIRIAEAVWIPIYGEEQILKQRPFKAVLKNGIWIVQGSFFEKYNYKGKGPPPRGGTAIAEISKKDGRIIRVDHGK